MTIASKSPQFDAVVVGSGPNGLAAAITLAQHGLSVAVLEAATTVGGGARSAELTLPGFTHDVCSAVYPLGIGSPFFKTLPLQDHGLRWVHPDAPMAHPFDDGSAVTLERSVEATADSLGSDGRAYRKLIQPLVENWDYLAAQLLGPMRPTRRPFALARFGLKAIRSARGLATARFETPRGRGFFAGLGAHSMMPIEHPLTASFGLVLGMAGHSVGWPVARAGSQSVSDALASYLGSIGGKIVTDSPVTSLDDLPPARAVLFDLTPRQIVKIAGERLPARYRRRLEGYRYGAGAFKMDFALDGPVPWKAADCVRAGTVHLGGTMDEIGESERATSRGEHAERPYVLVAQPSLFDTTRAPDGKHTVWAYCHVPNGSTYDMSDRIEAQIERFAPGFRDRILARSVKSPGELEEYNPNYVGGDINGGIQDFRQMFTRPTMRVVPYSTPVKGLYICSSSTPPGGGVHGMCGHWAARSAIRALF